VARFSFVIQRRDASGDKTESESLPDLCQFLLGVVGQVIQFARPAVPVPAVAEVAFDLVQHGMDPGGGIGLILLHEAMGFIPASGERQLDGGEQGFVHARTFMPEASRWIKLVETRDYP